MPINSTLQDVTTRIISRSKKFRTAYIERMRNAEKNGPRRSHLTCGNQAHAYAAMGRDKKNLADRDEANIGIISAYNDMLSAHQPFEKFPDLIKSTARSRGATAQMAGGVPAMCDGITQGQTGMELSLFSRDVIAMASGIALSHNTYDAAVYLGVCDKIVPGLVIAAATFGHIPSIFLPAGPMPSGLPNEVKARVRQKFAAGEIDRKELMRAEMASYHSPGTCTFFGTANSNQMLMEVMGLHLPGSSFINPNTDMRDALTSYGVNRLLEITALGKNYIPVCDILDERTFVNGIVGLMATGGSTNLVLHLPAMARAAGIIIKLEDFEAISSITPLIAKIYPNGLADINKFHAAGGISFLISQLLDAGLLHDDVKTVMGKGLHRYTKEPKLTEKGITFELAAEGSYNEKILRPVNNPFKSTGGLKKLEGSLGEGIMKVSAVSTEHYTIKAPVKIFHSQESVRSAFQRDEFKKDTIIVVRFQGPQANGMPELHGLTPILSVLQDRGLKIALLTDGRMSGASGKVPAVIHITPEAIAGGPLARLQEGDIVRIDAINGIIDVLSDEFEKRIPTQVDLSENRFGVGRELFPLFRQHAASASEGAGIFRFF